MKHFKGLSLIIVFVLLFQLVFSVTLLKANDNIFIRAYSTAPEMLTEYARVGMKLVEAYPTYILLEIQSHHLNWLQDKGILFLEEKDISILRFNDHLVYSQLDKNIQLPAYLFDKHSLSMDSALYLLQWIGPEKVEWKHTIEAYDIELLFPLHQYGWICRATPDVLAKVQQLRFVRAWGAIPFSAKIHPYLTFAPDLPESLSIQIQAQYPFDVDSFIDQTKIQKEQIELQASAPISKIIVSDLPLEWLSIVASNNQVLTIERYEPYDVFNHRAARVIGTQRLFNGLNVATIPGLDGSGEIAGVADTGIRSTHPDFWNPTFSDKVIATFPTNWDDYHSHGSHVAGTVAGTGASSANRMQKGIAYNARLVSQNFLGNQNYYNTLGGLYALLQEAYNAGVRTHNNSWGYNWSSFYHVYGAGEYTSGARDIDRFLWDHMDFTMVKSAGNNRSSNFYIPYYNFYGPYPFSRGTRTITADSNAKNLICVGALENENGSPVGHPSSWGRTQSIQRNIAWFSSTGPTHDGRIKPDIVAPGDPLLSVNRNHLNSPYSLYTSMSGTSMSGPVVTGSAVLVRQFYRDYHQLSSNEISSALVKATLINGGKQGLFDSDAVRSGYYPYDNQPFPQDPNSYTGFGLINLKESLQPENKNVLFINAYDPLNHQLGLSNQKLLDTYYIKAKESNFPLKATLVWTDYADSLLPPNASSSALNQKDLINNLHFEILDMNNMTNYRGNQMKNGFSLPNPVNFDHINNVEQIVLPGTNDSTYRIQVFSMDPISSDLAHNYHQPYALVLSGEDIVWINDDDLPHDWKPVQPMTFTAKTTCDGIQLQWSDPKYTSDSPAYFLLHRRIWTGPNAGQLSVHRFESGTKQYLDQAISWGQEYYYTLSAYDSNQNLLAQAPGVMSGWIVPPYRPSLFAALVDETVQLYWNKPKEGTCPVSLYRIYRSSSNTPLRTRQDSLASSYQSGTLIAELPANTSNFIDSTALPGQDWYYTLEAVDSRGFNSIPSSPLKVFISPSSQQVNLWLEAAKSELCPGELLTVRISIQNPTDDAVTKTKLLISPNRDIIFQKIDGLRGASLPDGSFEFDLPALAAHRTTSYIAYFEASKKITQDKEASLLFSIRNQEKILDSVLLPVLVKKCQQGNPAPYLSIQLKNLELDPDSGDRYLPLSKALEAEISWQHMTAPFVLSIDWGDGEKEVQNALWSNKIFLEHQYKTDSSFRINLSLSDANGKSIQSELVIRVRKE
jgi:subtilisin family serine protease